MSETINIGVFTPHEVQMLDLATIDVLGTMSKAYLSQIHFLPAHMAPLAPNVNIFYISTPSQGQLIPLTSNAFIKATHTYLDDEVAPGKLDVVVVPGPAPGIAFDKGAIEWLKNQGATKGVDILSVCTGIYLCGEAGLGDGKQVSGPRGLQSELKKRFPKMKLVGEEYRWIRDGNLWSSGGVTNGNDLMAAYARESGRFHSTIAEIGSQLTDVGDRGQKYGQGQTGFMLGFAWQIIKAWFAAPNKKKGN